MKEDYIKYTVEELALETDFIRWVQMEDAALQNAWESWLATHPDQREKVDTARQLVEAVAALDVPMPAARKTALWEKIDQATPSEAPAPQLRPLKSRRRYWWAAAASVLLLTAAGWWAFGAERSQPILQMADIGEQFEEKLPDGSVVYANAVTSLRYDAGLWRKQRAVELEGEAFFEVAKGKKFTVNTPQGDVEVLGTSFNVLARAEAFEVICYTGKVRVTTGSQQLDLTPGQAAVLQAGQLEPKAVTHQNDIAYRQKVHHFDQRPLAEVFAELERQYQISVTYPDSIGSQPYTGFFLGNALEEAFQTICWPMQLEYKQLDPGQYSIQPKSE